MAKFGDRVKEFVARQRALDEAAPPAPVGCAHPNPVEAPDGWHWCVECDAEWWETSHG